MTPFLLLSALCTSIGFLTAILPSGVRADELGQAKAEPAVAAEVNAPRDPGPTF